MSEWRTDDRPENALRVGAISRVSQTHRTTGDTAHLLTFSDGRQIRVLPDGTSGQRRSRAVRAAMEDAEALGGESVDLIETYMVGRLAQAGLTWEPVGNVREVTVEEWLGAWFDYRNFDAPGRLALELLEDLADDGWQIVRSE